MPDIDQIDRQHLDGDIMRLGRIVNNRWVSGKVPSGVVNYIITKLIGLIIWPETYEEYNQAIGILECAKLELYRRQVAAYEDKKKEENGDVF